MTTYVHELGHAICLHHEFVRVDRNEYLSFRNCDNPPKIKNSVTTKGHMFDYRSQMSYDCFGCAGVPTMQGALSCRSYDGFSVIDADKVNAFYNCKGSLLLFNFILKDNDKVEDANFKYERMRFPPLVSRRYADKL